MFFTIFLVCRQTFFDAKCATSSKRLRNTGLELNIYILQGKVPNFLLLVHNFCRS